VALAALLKKNKEAFWQRYGLFVCLPDWDAGEQSRRCTGSVFR